MSDDKVNILKRALIREKLARKEAEEILETKTLELYKLTQQLKDVNHSLEEKVVKKDLELQGVFKNIVDAYCVIDMSGNVLEMNTATTKLFNFKEIKKGINLLKFILKEDLSHAKKACLLLKKEGAIEDFKVRMVTRNGLVKQLHINASLILDSTGKPIAVQGIARDITEDQKLKNDILESESRLKILIENLDSGILLEDEDRKIVVSNQKFCELFGIPVHPEQLVGEDCSNAAEQSKLLFENPEKFVADINELTRAKKESLSEEIRMVNGKILLRDFIPIYRNNTYKGHLWSYKDVTSERQAQQNRIESENNLKILVQNLDHGVFMDDKDGFAVLANKKLCEQFQIAKAPDLIPGDDFSNKAEEMKLLFKEPDKFYTRYKEITDLKKPVFGDVLEMMNGKVLERNYIPIFKNNKFNGEIWTFNDITLKRTFDKNIEAQKQKYSSIIANMNLGLIEADVNNNIIMVNQSFIDLTGYTKDELIGMPAIEVLVPEENRDEAYDIANNTKSGKLGSNEILIKNKRGELKLLLVSSAPNYDDDNVITGSIGVVLDISDIKNLQNQKEVLLKNLEKSNEELKEYAHIVSHDLKSPLRSIFALVSWIKEDNIALLDEESLTNIKLIESTLEKMEQLITDVLNYSSVTSGAIEVQPVNLNEVIEDIQQLLFFPEHISLKIVRQLPVIRGDRTRFQQLFQNLISNAIRYIDKDIGIIEVDVKEFKTHYQFSVKDNGVGIDKKYFDKIFKIFHSLNENKESTGIGLSIVKKIVDIYNGEIWLESEEMVGTTFYFTIKK
ncbi:MAG: PAS domain S-box protein [Winogradskyella arenosi]